MTSRQPILGPNRSSVALLTALIVLFLAPCWIQGWVAGWIDG